MISGISTVCFAASYVVAFALELTRLFFRSGLRGALLIGFGAAGLLAHTLFLAYRAANTETTFFDWYLFAAWLLVAAYLFSLWLAPKTPTGLFVLPLALGMIGLAHLDGSQNGNPQPAHWWATAHGVFLGLGTAGVFLGFVAGVMYLTQDHRLKHPGGLWSRFTLPSLETLRDLNTRSLIASVWLVLAGFVTGVILNLQVARSSQTPLSWADPVIWSSAALAVWLLVAAGFSAWYRPARQGRKVAYLTLTSFAFLLLVLATQFLLPTRHGAIRSEGAGPARAAESEAT